MSKCIACGFDGDAQVVAQWNFILDMSAYSGNQIGGNEKGRNGYKYRKAKAEYRKALRCKLAHIDDAKSKRRIWVTRMYRKKKRPYDIDNLYWGLKPLIDILVTENVFIDDDPENLERIYSQLPSHTDNDAIHIRIEELGE